MKLLNPLVLMFFASIPFANVAYGQGNLKSIENISSELVGLRQEIEELHSQINFEKDTYRDQIRAYSNQKSDLNVKINRAELNTVDLQREIKKLAEKSNRADTAEVSDTLKKLINKIKPTVQTSLPFKLEQRMSALNDIEARLVSGVVTPNKAANQLWAFVEDELALGKSSGIYNDTIDINGASSLVKLLRIGKLAYFYKSPEGSYGLVKRGKTGWVNTQIELAKDNALLGKLFDSYAKNIRSGLFTVPNFLPEK